MMQPIWRGWAPWAWCSSPARADAATARKSGLNPSSYWPAPGFWLKPCAGSMAKSGAIVGVDADVVVREIAGVDRLLVASPAQCDTHQDFCFLHHPLAIFLGVFGVTPAIAGHQSVAQPQARTGYIKVGNARIPDGAKNAAQVGVGSVKRGLDQRRMGNGVGDLQGFLGASCLFHTHGNELGGAFGITNNLLGKLQCSVRQGMEESCIAGVIAVFYA